MLEVRVRSGTWENFSVQVRSQGKFENQAIWVKSDLAFIKEDSGLTFFPFLVPWLNRYPSCVPQFSQLQNASRVTPGPQ